VVHPIRFTHVRPILYGFSPSSQLPASSAWPIRSMKLGAGSWELGLSYFWEEQIWNVISHERCLCTFSQLPGFGDFDWLVVFPHTIVNLLTNLRFLLCVQAFYWRRFLLKMAANHAIRTCTHHQLAYNFEKLNYCTHVWYGFFFCCVKHFSHAWVERGLVGCNPTALTWDAQTLWCASSRT
jgi:hypothetical protein